MTEDYWLQLALPMEMVDYVAVRAGERKLRLFAAACCRMVGRVDVAELCERVADNLADPTDLQLPRQWPAPRFWPRNTWGSNPQRVPVSHQVHEVILAAVQESAATAARDAARESFPQLQGRLTNSAHDIFGNPFHPSRMEKSWLRWNDGTIPKIAQGIYEERAFDHLPILADALLDAGCDNEDILAHCRNEGPHVRGCWVIDLILGKE